jgi:hypothetical protein
MEKENSYTKYNGRIGATNEIYPKVQVTFDTIVVFDDLEHKKIARKHIQTIYVHADQIRDRKIIENAYDLFIEECKSSIKYGKYVEGADIKII